jgi:hypothetical protein
VPAGINKAASNLGASLIVTIPFIARVGPFAERLEQVVPRTAAARPRGVPQSPVALRVGLVVIIWTSLPSAFPVPMPSCTVPSPA